MERLSFVLIGNGVGSTTSISRSCKEYRHPHEQPWGVYEMIDFQRMELRSTLKSRLSGTVSVVYRDIESLEELDGRTVHGVHAFCFVGDELVIVYSKTKGYWSLPGGGVEVGETAEEAIVREVLEETNMRVLKQHIIGYQDISEPHRITTQVRSVCIVEPVGPFIADADPEGDVTEIKLIDPKDIKQYFDWSEIGEHILSQALKFKRLL